MRKLTACILPLLFATACATAPPEPSILSLSDPSSVTEENVTVNADSYMDKQRQNVFFRASFPGESVLAVHLSIENQRKAPVRIDPSAVTVVLPDGNSLRPKESKILVDFLGIAPEPPPLFSMRGMP